jgi:hypothetical protein
MPEGESSSVPVASGAAAQARSFVNPRWRRNKRSQPVIADMGRAPNAADMARGASAQGERALKRRFVTAFRFGDG